jgi:beta-galactosidase/beta-glucuronidase
MLYPQANRFRQSQDLSGFWNFRFDPEDRGQSAGWSNGFEQAQPIAVRRDQLLLNGELITLRGFGRHEDFPVLGRGLAPAVIVKDYALMHWVGANSFRTTHYPYSEQMMDLADRLGFLVIDETPAVGLFFAEEGLQRRFDLCRQYTSDLITRDKNHPSVIMGVWRTSRIQRPLRQSPFSSSSRRWRRNKIPRVR